MTSGANATTMMLSRKSWPCRHRRKQDQACDLAVDLVHRQRGDTLRMKTVPLVRALLETTAVTACGVKGSSEVVKHVIRLRPRGTQCRRYAAWQATHCCMTVPSAASTGRTSLLTLPVCASTANRLAARCICVPISCIPCGMKGAMCKAP